MRIAIDPWVLASRFSHHGTHVYARNLVAQFHKLAASHAGVEFCLFRPSGNVNGDKLFQPSPGFELVAAPMVRNDRLWRLAGANRAAARSHADLLFSPTSNTLAWGKVPVVATIHDTTPTVMPSHSGRVNFMLRSLMRAAVKFSRAIITVSEYSKQDLIKTYGVAGEKISVVYNGYDRSVFNAAPVDAEKLRVLREKLGIRRPYVFHHSVIQPRKNLVRLIQAYRLLLEKNPSMELDLVLAGPLGWQYEGVVAAAQGHEHARGRVLLPGALADVELAALIKGASLVVIPSLYEGFCLPMIEAMACGAAVIASGTSCLPEVSGKTLRYFNPTSVEEMAEQMQSVLCDAALARELQQRGLQRAEAFSWERCAEETLRVLLNAAPGDEPKMSDCVRQ
ncbi:MAG: glycosyltransferase family 4 protein [Acidobacteriia bacterium]|nr:glycosyltransferase family 4 protein [Terriglobia bacterium]